MTPTRLFVILVTLFLVGVTVWGLGRGIDHMLDPCRTEAQRSVTPVCMTGSR
jgi:hypothetical protein